MTKHTVIEETPFVMAFGVEAVIPAEMGLPSLHVENYDEEDNDEHMMPILDLVEEKR